MANTVGRSANSANNGNRDVKGGDATSANLHLGQGDVGKRVQERDDGSPDKPSSLSFPSRQERFTAVRSKLVDLLVALESKPDLQAQQDSSTRGLLIYIGQLKAAFQTAPDFPKFQAPLTELCKLFGVKRTFQQDKDIKALEKKIRGLDKEEIPGLIKSYEEQRASHPDLGREDDREAVVPELTVDSSLVTISQERHPFTPNSANGEVPQAAEQDSSLTISELFLAEHRDISPQKLAALRAAAAEGKQVVFHFGIGSCSEGMPSAGTPTFVVGIEKEDTLRNLARLLQDASSKLQKNPEPNPKLQAKLRELVPVREFAALPNAALLVSDWENISPKLYGTADRVICVFPGHDVLNDEQAIMQFANAAMQVLKPGGVLEVITELPGLTPAGTWMLDRFNRTIQSQSLADGEVVNERLNFDTQTPLPDYLQTS